MPTQYPDLFAALAAPFEPHQVKLKPGQGGRQIHFVSARTIMNRMDEVLGPENYWDEYVPGQNSVLCKLTIRLPDGSTVTKADAGGYAGMADQGDDDKSGYSDAFKRAAAKFGVSRYLYRDGVPQFVREREPGIDGPIQGTAPQNDQPQRQQGGYQQQAPQQRQAPQQQYQQQQPARDDRQGGQNGHQNGNGGNGNGQGQGPPPRSGKALFAWVKDMEQRHDVGLLKYLNGFAKLQEFPNRMIDFDAEQVALCHEEAVRKIASIQPNASQSESSSY